MSSESPAVVLYSSDGYELAVVPGSALPTQPRAILIDGTDGTNSRTMLVDTSGRPNVVGAAAAGAAPSGNPVYIGASVTTAAPTYTTGTVNALSLTTGGLLRIDGTGGVFNSQSVGADGATALAFDTQVGGIVTTAAPTYTTGNLDALSLTTRGGLRIDGVYPAGTANATAADVSVSGGYVTTAAPAYTTGLLEPLSLDTTGNLRTTNPSVGTDGAAFLGFDTQVGGRVTTAAPTYTTGNLDGLSLTTLGGLRIDGVYAAGTANATAADVMNSGGYVTTGNPTYTTGLLEPLSLDTSGNLRVTGSFQTNKSSTGTITSVAASATSVSLLATNAARVGASFYNDSANQLYIALSASSATTSVFTIKIMPNSYFDLPVDYTGAINGVWNGNLGSVRVTEFT